MPLLLANRAARALSTFVLLASLSACSPTVREDRSINFSRQSGDVAFQHGRDGVYVATGKGEQLEKIFDVGEDVLAVSSPCWAPNDRRLIFTTAMADTSSGEPSHMQSMPRWDANPVGNLYPPQAVHYSCWLRAAPGEKKWEASPKPVELFRAACDHIGYVAANLAVRWHPDGRRILYLDRTNDGRHVLMELRLDSGKRKQVLPHAAKAIVFDWSPDDSHLLCVLANAPRQREDGIWLSPADGEAAWRVPDSEQIAESLDSGLLERLRATRPAWSSDGKRFAFAVHKFVERAVDDTNSPQRTSDDRPMIETHSEIRIVDVANRSATTIVNCQAAVRDLHWHPDGRRMGFVEERESPVLRIAQLAFSDAERIPTVSPRIAGPVRKFAGWNRDGSQFAYVTPDDVPTHRAENWALLLPPVRDPRDRVYVVEDARENAAIDAEDKVEHDIGPGRMVHAGMRITFPQWSPKEDSLSLWGTFSPTHRSLLSSLLPWSLRPGDPAAILDGDEGRIRWMAINADEKAQVGNYHLLRKEYQQAWRWYEEAAEGRPADQPLRIRDFSEIERRLRGAAFFEYYCLSKLGREEEAAERLASFRTGLTFDLSDLHGGRRDRDGEFASADAEAWRRLADHASAVVQCLTIAEAFLSIDAVDDGVAFFRDDLQTAEGDTRRLAAALCLSQLLLLSEDDQGYLQLASETLAPLLISLHETPSETGEDREAAVHVTREVERSYLTMLGRAALTPLISPKFLDRLPEGVVREHVDLWRAKRAAVEEEMPRLAIDLFLHAAWRRLGDAVRSEAAARRARDNPALGQFGGGPSLDTMDEFIDEACKFRWN
ncbi:MAG: hypothetical protein RIC55_02725 [Pirellulaceae bacterium]